MTDWLSSTTSIIADLPHLPQPGLANHTCLLYSHLHYSITYEANNIYDFPTVPRAITVKDKPIKTVANANMYKYNNIIK